MTSTRRALFHSYLTNYVTLGLNFVASVIIARLLTPSEIGVFSIAAAFVALGHVIRDFGVSQYIIQERDLTPDKIRAAFTVTLLIGWSIALVMWFIAPFSGMFYEHQGVSDVLALLTVNFVLLPFGSITAAYLNRQMRLDKVMWIKVSSAALQTVTAVACAYQGLSYMSLAWGALAGTGATILVTNLVRPKELPLRPSLRGIREVLGFGSKLGATRILGHISEVTPELVLGKTMGMHAVGLWSRAQGTITLFGTLIMRSSAAVISPAFAEARRQQRDLKTPYLFVLAAVTGLAWPFYAGLAILAPDLILVLFGEQWMPAVPYVQLWCISAAVYYLSSVFSEVLISTGHLDRMVRIDLLISTTRILLTGIAATISIELILVSYIFLGALRIVLHRRNMREVLDIGFGDLFRISLVSLQPAMAVAAAALLSQHALAQAEVTAPAAKLAIGILTSGVVLLAALVITRHPLRAEVLRILTHLRRGTGSPPGSGK